MTLLRPKYLDKRRAGLSSQSCFILDFDGTLADSLPLAMDLFYKWSKRDPLPADEVQALRNKTIKEVLAHFNISLWRVPGLLVMARTQVGRRLGEVPLFTGMDTTLKQLHASGNMLHVMSSNSPVNVTSFLKNHKIESYFTGIFGNAGIFGKTPVMKKIMQKYHLTPKDCYYVGDETRDIDAAKKAGISSVAVNWGYNGEKILKHHKPDFFITKPEELLKLVQS